MQIFGYFISLVQFLGQTAVTLKLTNILHIFTKGGVLYFVFYPRTRPRTSLQCFALDSRCSEAKQDKLG